MRVLAPSQLPSAGWLECHGRRAQAAVCRALGPSSAHRRLETWLREPPGERPESGRVQVQTQHTSCGWWILLRIQGACPSACPGQSALPAGLAPCACLSLWDGLPISRSSGQHLEGNTHGLRELRHGQFWGRHSAITPSKHIRGART